MSSARPACHAEIMNRITTRTRHATPAPIDRTQLALRRAAEREAWRALVADGERLARSARAPHYAPVARRMYADALLAWRETRRALDMALVPVPAAPTPRRPGRRPQTKRAWRRLARG